MQDQKVTLVLAVLQIMQTTSSSHPLNSTQVIDRLYEQYHIDCFDRRQIYDAIEILEQLGYRFITCPNTKLGRYMVGHASLWEAKMRMDSISQSKALSDQAKKEMLAAIMNSLPEEYRNYISKLPVVDAKYSIQDEKSHENIDTTIKCIAKKKMVEFQYIAYDIEMVPFFKHNMKNYHISPYMIYYSNDTCYLIGAEVDLNEGIDQIKHFRFDRIINLRSSGQHWIDIKRFCKENASLYLTDYVSKSIDHYGEQEILLELEVTYSTTVMDIIRDRCGAHFYCKKVNDQRAYISFPVRTGPTLKGWLMQNMRMFKVVGPAELITELQDEYRFGLEQYL